MDDDDSWFGSGLRGGGGKLGRTDTTHSMEAYPPAPAARTQLRRLLEPQVRSSPNYRNSTAPHPLAVVFRVHSIY